MGDLETPTDAAVAPEKRLPVPDQASRGFYEGALAGRLMLLRCAKCGTYMSPTAGAGTPVESLRRRCVRCLSNALAWAPSTGRGTLYSFAIMHVVYDPSFAGDVPYNLALVELEEGVRITSQVVGCPNDELEIGMPLRVTFERLSEDVAVPKFEPGE
jgi:uncharacterized OB-fold protein